MIFEFATAQPKGFAFTLILGVLVSMFTAVVATRALLGLLSDFAFFNRPSFMGVRAADIHTVDDEAEQRPAPAAAPGLGLVGQRRRLGVHVGRRRRGARRRRLGRAPPSAARRPRERRRSRP